MHGALCRKRAATRSTVVRHCTMGFYRDRVFPRIMNMACNTKETRRIRAAVCAPLTGEVLEIGFGTGLNLPHLPPSVTRLRAVDPLKTGRHLAGERLASGGRQVDDDERLDLRRDRHRIGACDLVAVGLAGAVERDQLHLAAIGLVVGVVVADERRCGPLL